MHYYFDKSLKTREIKCEEIVTNLTIIISKKYSDIFD
jgi:hypothetical protein